uniref:Ubiquitin thioesterase OTU n=1 Tax=Trichobilharzia regenti TaxID=157069 RepID=A0AA85JZ61_TRIRE|nr:unnamed protein product [Trichobilharzia regenti]
MQTCQLTSSSNDLFKLRCRYRTGQYALNGLTVNSTLHDLLQAITSLIGIPSTCLSLFYGYPPRKLDCSTAACLTRRLHEIPLRSGDLITVDDVIGERKSPASSVNSQLHSYNRGIPMANASTTTAATTTATPTTTTPANTNTQIVNNSLEPRVVRLCAPSDNSCLFTSALFCINNHDSRLKIGTEVVTNVTAVSQLRELISGIVLSDPVKYSEAFLGMSNEEYSQQIRQPDKWGGGIEVSILSQLYEVEICIVDIESCRIDRFGEDHNYPKRILLIYDGIHYDPLAQEYPKRDCLVTVFPTSDDSILLEAQQLASKARAEWAFTDLASFTLLCRQCDAPLVGQAAAQKHAQLTGHTQFREIAH